MAQRTCSVTECERTQFGLGFCQIHHYRWRKYSSTDLPPKPTDEDRFWAKVDRSDPDGCWPWTAARDRDGYGSFKADGGQRRAPRWIYQHLHGELPPDVLVRHRCDNPPCVRPDHLTQGLALDNSADAVERGRLVTGDQHHTRRNPERQRGERNASSRLSEQQVYAIRGEYAGGATQVALAKRHDVSQALVSQIVRRVIWNHLE